MTLQLPHVSPVVKGFRFEGVQAHQTRQALAVEIRKTIETLIKSPYVPGWHGMFYKFRDCIEPGKVRDLARLPYPVAGPNNTAGIKIGCVYARLSWIIQRYWDQCFDDTDYAPGIREACADVRAWAAYGIHKCEICGNQRLGYWLKSK